METTTEVTVIVTSEALRGAMEVATSIRHSLVIRAKVEAEMVAQGSNRQQLDWIREASNEAAAVLQMLEEIIRAASQ